MMLPIFALFWECIYPSVKFCARYRAFYEAAFYKRQLKIIFGREFDVRGDPAAKEGEITIATL